MALIGGTQDDKAAGAARRKRSNGRSNESNSASSRSATFADDPLDPMLEVKKRARRRLIGAIALVLGAIVFVPMIFDSGTKLVVDDISIQIPDKNSSFDATPARVNPPANPSSAPDSVSASAPAGLTSPTAAPSTPPAAPAVIAGAAAVVAPSVAPTAPTTGPAVASIPAKPADKPVKPQTEAAKTGDDPRAVSLLEGKTEAEARADAKSEGTSQSFAVQIGAFSDIVKVKSLREKLNAGGFKTYTEVVKTNQGDRTRLRTGPYASRTDADKAQERIKKLFVLDATVVPL
jgi:DedD protein